MQNLPPVHQPYPYQTVGAIQACRNNHNLIADEPGLGKTTQAILAAELMQSQRTIVVCPPTLITNWANEIEISNHTRRHPEQTIHAIYPATKKPLPLPEAGWVIVSDSLLTARKKLAGELANWQADVLIIDEAHRFKNEYAKRTKTATALSYSSRYQIALTGTPILSNPADLYPLLRILRKLDVFPGNFLDRYTRERIFYVRDREVIKREPLKANLPELQYLMDKHVWTRRTKAQVLTELPEKTRNTVWVDVKATDLAEAFEPVHKSLEKFLAHHTTSQLEEWAHDSRGLVAGLRRTTGLVKVPAAVDWISEHHAGTGRPLIVWAWHTDVINELSQQCKKAGLKVAQIKGDTKQQDRDTYIAAFQSGQLDVLVCQIIAAGTGLTLTKASEALFVETDWLPANVTQAEDRIHRISQTSKVTITTLLAKDTLDPVIHRVLGENIRLLDALMPGSDHQVTDVKSTERVSEILLRYAQDYLSLPAGDLLAA